MHMKVFDILVQKEENGGFSVQNLAFEGCYSQGETIEEAIANIKEATELCLETNEKPIQQYSEASLYKLAV
jgi:predicted RNase H-like HicB family nuclease